MLHMPEDYKLSVVLPCYNEAKNLEKLIPKLHSVIKSINISYEIIAIDRAVNSDRTKAICLPQQVKHINRAPSDCYGDAIRTAINQAQGSHVIFMDADGSHSPSFIAKLYAEKNNADIVVASRYVKGGKTDNSKVLIAMSRLVNFGYSFFLNIPCKDISNSFKMYKRTDLSNLTLLCDHFDIIEEIFYKILKQNTACKIKEIPFHFQERDQGKTKRNLFIFAITYIYTLLKLRFLGRLQS